LIGCSTARGSNLEAAILTDFQPLDMQKPTGKVGFGVVIASELRRMQQREYTT